MPEQNAPKLTYCGAYDSEALAQMNITGLLQLSEQTRWSKTNDRTKPYSEDIKTVRSRIAKELATRNDLRRRHPAPPAGTSVTIAEELKDWPFAACSEAPAPGTTGTVIDYRAAVLGLKRRAWEIKVARRFYVPVKMGDDFDSAPGSSFPVPVWQIAEVVSSNT